MPGEKKMEDMLRVIAMSLLFTGVLVSTLESLETVRLGDQYYYFQTAEYENGSTDWDKFTSWENADKFCRSHGLQLASVETERENDLLVKYGLTKFPLDVPLWWFKLGGSDSEQEGTWRWTSGQTFNFTKWVKGQPDSWNGDEDCLVMSIWRDGRDGWFDVSCSGNGMFICEMEEVAP